MGGRGGSSTTQYKPSTTTILRKNPNKDTQEIYTKNGKYSKEREKVHNRIIKSIMRQTSSNKKATQEAILVTGNSPESIKYATREVQSKYRKIAQISPKDFISKLPEYKNLVRRGFSKEEARKKVQREAVDVYKKTLNALGKNKKSYILSMPLTSSTATKSLVNGLKKQGYNVHIVYSNHNGRDNSKTLVAYNSATPNTKHTFFDYSKGKLSTNRKLSSMKYRRFRTVSKKVRKTTALTKLPKQYKIKRKQVDYTKPKVAPIRKKTTNKLTKAQFTKMMLEYQNRNKK